MRRVDEAQVILTDAEMAAAEQFDRLVRDGWSVPDAAKVVLNQMRPLPFEEFIDYLSNGTCRRWGQRVLIRPEVRRQINIDRKAALRPGRPPRSDV